jgi:phage terminase Nu1 subunit (DNA packaging protein)
MGKPISQRELAKRWKCSQPYIAKLVRRGMPMTSERAAAKWRQAESKRGPVNARAKATAATTVEPFVSAESEAPTGYDRDGQHGPGLVAHVMRLRQTVEMFRKEIESAKDLNTRAQAAKNYATTLNALRQFEKDLPGILKSIGAVIDANQAQLCWTTIVSAFARRLRSIPDRDACNLAGCNEDEIAEKLRTIIEAAFSLIRKDWSATYEEYCNNQGGADDV